MIEIRSTSPDDWPAYREIRLLALQNSPEAFGSTYAREASFDEQVWRDRLAARSTYTAWDGGICIGTATGIPDQNGDDGGRELVGMFVVPEWRGRGVAGGLIDAVIDWARHDGGRRLGLWVVTDNDRARGAYQRFGFVESGRRQPVHDDDPSRLEDYLVLDLDA